MENTVLCHWFLTSTFSFFFVSWIINIFEILSTCRRVYWLLKNASVQLAFTQFLIASKFNNYIPRIVDIPQTKCYSCLNNLYSWRDFERDVICNYVVYASPQFGFLWACTQKVANLLSGHNK